jgi:hypothetical protein
VQPAATPAASAATAATPQNQELSEFLNKHGLSQYYDIMVELEYDSLDVILRLSPEEVDEMFTDIQAKPGAKKKFRFAIEDQRAQKQATLEPAVSPAALAPTAAHAHAAPLLPTRKDEISPRPTTNARTPPPATKPRGPAFDYGDEEDFTPRGSTVEPPPRPSNVGAPPITVRPGQRPPSFVPPADTAPKLPDR